MHEDGLPDAGSAEESDFSAFAVRFQQIHDLDARLQQLDALGLVLVARSGAVDRPVLGVADGAGLVDRAAQHVHDAAQRAAANRNCDSLAGRIHRHAAAQTVRGAHRNGTYHAIAQLLLYLKGQTCFSGR